MGQWLSHERQKPINGEAVTMARIIKGSQDLGSEGNLWMYSMVAKMQNVAKRIQITFSEISQNCPELSSQNPQFERTELFGRRIE
jgi:hypothetical protein